MSKIDRTVKLLFVALVLGIWVLVLRPFSPISPAQAQPEAKGETGRFQVTAVGSGIFVLDTKTGLLKGIAGKPVAGTWENNYREILKAYVDDTKTSAIK